ncbi:TfuA-related McrA-glycine thioamidation protein [Methanobrevibacter sp. OttesenSCG-928-I08]|nr:TfuA-related McrA-glycine thioamidation protein [Methanobrevibacter sp. OttesenSCG-928-I08]
MRKIIVYTGLSISHEEARSILDNDSENEIIYKKPIKRGDILEDIKINPDIIVIIDGVFHQSPAVGHKEILEAIKRDILVVGASSMGALRASELDSLGMIGIGYVYNEYSNGNITSDDDVAVVLDPDTLEQLSEALVSINYILNQAENENIINSAEKEEIIKITKSIYYPKRTYSNILKKVDLNDKKKDNLISFIRNSKDIKKEDSKKVLEYIKKRIS